MVSRARGWAFALGLIVCVSLGVAAPSAAASFVTPSNGPLQVAVSGAGVPGAVTVVVGGFPSPALVYIEQCDGVSPSTPSWSPTTHCDLGSSPTPAIVSSDGVASFPATDPNRAFHPFLGESPQSLFNCTGAGVHATADDLPSYDNCTVRVSTNNTVVTADQVFIGLRFTTQTALNPVAPREPGAIQRGVAHANKSSGNTQRTEPVHANSTRPRSMSPRGRSGSRSTEQKSTGATVCTADCAQATAVVSRADAPGLLSIGQGDVATGYAVVLLGGFLAVVAVQMRRRSSRVDVGQKDAA